MAKIENFSVFKITDDEELIEKVLGDDDTPLPGSRFLVLNVYKGTQVEAILEDCDGEFDLEDPPAFFTTKSFKKIAQYEGMICRGKVNTF